MTEPLKVAQLPDGRELEFPSNTPMSVIQAKVRELLRPPQDQTSAKQVFGREATAGLLDTMTGCPVAALPTKPKVSAPV